jgi:hypothetical protein
MSTRSAAALARRGADSAGVVAGDGTTGVSIRRCSGLMSAGLLREAIPIADSDTAGTTAASRPGGELVRPDALRRAD